MMDSLGLPTQASRMLEIGIEEQEDEMLQYDEES
jgi:hypothetical protein